MKTLIALLVSTLTGCTSIHTYVDGWPELKTVVHVVPDGQVYPSCSSLLSWWQKAIITLPLACSKISLDKGTCDIYVGETSTESTLQHELEHCKGGDHGDILQKGFDKWRAGK